MSVRGNGSYLGPRPTGPTTDVASGWWDLRNQFRYKREATWPKSLVSPPTISDLELWLDAADASTMFDATTGGSLVANSAGVARWEDKSGNSRHFTQGTAGNRPVRSVALQNGRDAISFDGANDFLQGSHGLAAQEPHTIFAAWNINSFSAGADRSILLLGNRTSAAQGVFEGLPFSYSSSNYGLRSPFADSTASPTVSLSQTSHNVFTFRISANAASLFVDSTERTVSNIYANLALTSAMEIGRGSIYDSTAYANLALYEVLVYSTSMSNDLVTQVRSYLLEKWALT